MGKTDDLVVVKDNKVINASYKLTLVEQRIILGCISRVDSTSELSKSDGFDIRVEEIRDLISKNRDMGSYYTAVKKAVDRLFERHITLDKEGSKRRWVYEVKYNQNEGMVTLYFSPTIIPYLSQLKGNFTKYKLEYVSRFRSSHSVHLYELLVQWLSKGEREVEIEWLKKVLGLEGKYTRTRNFIDVVIKKSVEDINLYSNLDVSFGTRKSGRKTTHIQFMFRPKSTRGKKPSLNRNVKEEIKVSGQREGVKRIRKDSRTGELKKMKEIISGIGKK